jgi:hypothetical protein
MIVLIAMVTGVSDVVAFDCTLWCQRFDDSLWLVTKKI